MPALHNTPQAESIEVNGNVGASANLDAMSAATSYQGALCKLVKLQMYLSDARYRPGYLIDFGAGKGEYARAITRANKLDVVAVEPDDSLHKAYSQDQICIATVTGLLAHTATGAYSLNVFEHIEDDIAALRVLASRCRPGSRIFILVPANPGLWTSMDSAVGHVRRYTPERLRHLAIGAGLRIEDEGWFDRTGYIATRALQLLMLLRLRSTTWSGLITHQQISSFDRVFRIIEPLLQCLRLPFGKNRWIVLRTAQPY